MLSISLNRPFSIFILILVYDLDNITRSITIVCHDSFVYVVTYRIWQSVAWRMSYKKRKLFTHSKHHGSPWFMVGWSVLLILLVSNLCGGFCLGWRGLFSFFLSLIFVLCHVCPMLPMSLNCPLLIFSSFFCWFARTVPKANGKSYNGEKSIHTNTWPCSWLDIYTYVRSSNPITTK